MLVQRLGFGPDVREALRFTFERWNGNGFPTHAQWRGDPARRCASCTSATTWRRSAASSRPSAPSRPPASAATARTTRRSPTCSSRTGASWFDRLAQDRAVGRRARPRARAAPDCWTATSSTTRSTVAADFIDLKSPYMGGHSRRCAQLAADAARVLGLAERGRHRAPPGRARARLRHHRRAELDLGQAGRAHAHGVRPRRAAPDADRADAAPLAGAGRAEPGRVRAPREVRRVRLPQARARRRRRPGSVRAGRDGDLRGADHRARRPSAVLATRTPPPSCAGSSRRACSSLARRRAVLVAAGHGEPAARVAQAAAAPGRAHPVARSTCCASRRGGSRRARSPIGSSSRRRPPTTTSSTSTPRSASRPAPPPRSWAMQHDVVQDLPAGPGRRRWSRSIGRTHLRPFGTLRTRLAEARNTAPGAASPATCQCRVTLPSTTSPPPPLRA